MGGSVALIGEKTGVCRFLVRKPEETDHLQDWCGRVDIINIDFRVAGGGMNRINLAHNKEM
jgi:hypothetical protein